MERHKRQRLFKSKAGREYLEAKDEYKQAFDTHMYAEEMLARAKVKLTPASEITSRKVAACYRAMLAARDRYAVAVVELHLSCGSQIAV